ncbi:phosphatase PAP2 family protein [Cellulomonas sp. URHB0016]
MSRQADRQLAGTAGPRGPAGHVELLVLVACFAAFTYLHGAVAHDFSSATADAGAVLSVERTLHLDVELAMNAWLSRHSALSTVAVYVYRSYYLVVAGVLAWVHVRHAAAYLPVRRALVAMFFLVLPVYWAVPLSPPRFALAGTVDVVAERDPRGSHALPAGADGQSYTAMPSMHVGLSAWCAWAVWSVLRDSHPRLALLPWLFPLTMTAVVLTTANHYVLDVVGSAVLLVTSVAAATVWGQHVGPRSELSAAAAPSPARRPQRLQRR